MPYGICMNHLVTDSSLVGDINSQNERISLCNFNNFDEDEVGTRDEHIVHAAACAVITTGASSVPILLSVEKGKKSIPSSSSPDIGQR